MPGIGRWVCRGFPLRWSVFLGLASGVFTCAATDFKVLNTNPNGAGSLAEAILNANATSGFDTIKFQLPGSPPFTITPTAPLPPLTDPVLIDGTSQLGYAGQPIIQLNGTSVPAESGLRLLTGSSGSTILGLVINRFGADAIHIENSSSNVLQGNFLGTDVWGTNNAGNGFNGVWIVNGSHSLIGGTTAAQRNVISGGNGYYGVFVQGASSSNVICGNYIGTSVTGLGDLGNLSVGVAIYGSPNNVIGGTASGAGNVISANHNAGVYIGAGATGNRVLGNRIGVNATGSLALGNWGAGVMIDDCTANLVGGVTPAARNFISGNGLDGVFLNSANNNAVQGNYIGTDATGLAAIGNWKPGVTLAAANNNLIGGAGGGGNVMAGNVQDGLFISAGSTGNRVEANLIGLDTTGLNALGNGFAGLTINASPANTIGGTAPGVGNVISGNASYGIWITNSVGNQVQGNWIGPDATGRGRKGNQLSGMRIEVASLNTIGGPVPGARNVISANVLDGIWFEGASVSNVVQGNFIGTDITGTNALSNQRAGVLIDVASNNLIGGTIPGSGNVISGNGDANDGPGIELVGGASGNIIQGNRIGTDVTGMVRIGNTYEGIYIQGAGGNLIGGSDAGAGNVIAACGTRGIYMNPGWSTTIQGNTIGATADGLGNLGSVFHAVELESGSTNNSIGGASRAAGNRIAFAQPIYAGVRVRDGAVGNAILSNLIYANGSASGGLGIDLSGYGVTANPTCNSGSGANLLQNFPALLAAYTVGNTTVRGSLTSVPGRAYRLQFFLNPVCDPKGYGQGQNYLGDAVVITAANCTTNFTATLPVSVPLGYVITATATDPANNTSEFSACVPVMSPPVLSIQSDASDFITLAWTNTAPGFMLKETDDLSPPVQWRPVTNSPINNVNGQFVVTRQTTNTSRFYLLSFE